MYIERELPVNNIVSSIVIHESLILTVIYWGIGRAATLLKTLLQYYGKLPGVAYPSFKDNCSTLNTKTGYKKVTNDKKTN